MAAVVPLLSAGLLLTSGCVSDGLAPLPNHPLSASELCSLAQADEQRAEAEDRLYDPHGEVEDEFVGVRADDPFFSPGEVYPPGRHHHEVAVRLRTRASKLRQEAVEDAQIEANAAAAAPVQDERLSELRGQSVPRPVSAAAFLGCGLPP